MQGGDARGDLLARGRNREGIADARAQTPRGLFVDRKNELFFAAFPPRALHHFERRRLLVGEHHGAVMDRKRASFAGLADPFPEMAVPLTLTICTGTLGANSGVASTPGCFAINCSNGSTCSGVTPIRKTLGMLGRRRLDDLGY